jgi:hypothetical protein
MQHPQSDDSARLRRVVRPSEGNEPVGWIVSGYRRFMHQRPSAPETTESKAREFQSLPPSADICWDSDVFEVTTAVVLTNADLRHQQALP